MNENIIVLDFEDEPKRIDGFFADEPNGVHGRVRIIDGLFFGHGRGFRLHFHGTILNGRFRFRDIEGERVLALFLKKPNAFTRIDPVGIRNLFVFLP